MVHIMGSWRSRGSELERPAGVSLVDMHVEMHMLTCALRDTMNGLPISGAHAHTPHEQTSRPDN
jgi:hypothetical protein